MRSRAVLVMVVLLAGCAASDPIDPFALHVQSNDGEGADDSDGGGVSDGGSPSEGGAPSKGGAPSEGGAPGGPVCGDGLIDSGETCDDANTVTGDGCALCQIECAASETQDPLTGHCYALFTTAMNQPSAEANCQAWGGAPGIGHLASIGNQAENDFVAGLASADTWIGADDFNGAFEWIDGTLFNFANWQTNEPNHPGVEHCMFMDSAAKWHDHNCGDATRPAYLCERAGSP